RAGGRNQTQYLTHAALIFFCVMLAIPLLYAMLLSTFTQSQAFAYLPRIIPGTDLGDNIRILFERNFGRQILNTLFIAFVVVVVKTATSLLAGLAFVFFRFPGKWFL